MNRATADVTQAQGNMRIDVFVARTFDTPRNQASQLVSDGCVTVNGVAVAKSHRVEPDDVVEVTWPAAAKPQAAPPVPPIMYEDDDLLVVHKPAGLVVHAGVGNESGTLVDALKAANITLADTSDPLRPGIVHRLDKDTSGVLVIAKSALAYTSIVEQLQSRTMHRSYVALVAGTPKAERGVIDGPIGRDPKARTRFAVVADGKPARTRYETRATVALSASGSDDVSLLDVTLDTGRTHQIRVHMATLGLKIIGDDVYGVTGKLAATLGLTRPFLHAHTVTFTHPVTAETRTVTAPLPEELHAALTRAGIAW